MLSQNDLKQLSKKGISEQSFNKQLKQFETGFPALNISQPAVLGKGISKLTDSEMETLIASYQKFQSSAKVQKFVPASGAATRMFKTLFAFRDSYKNSQEDYLKFISDQGSHSVWSFFDQLASYPFYKDLVALCYEKELDLDKLIEKHDYTTILDLILGEEGLKLGLLPKALVKFHRYTTHIRTAFDEQLAEARYYAVSKGKELHIHFTISKEFEAEFAARLGREKYFLEEDDDLSYMVTFSEQKTATDTIAVNKQNQPIRDEEGNLVFRPGGHGALIHNLNEIDADLIFIKNIDNVAPDRIKEKNKEYKMALAGLLLQKQEQIFSYLKELEQTTISKSKTDEILDFLSQELCVVLPATKKLSQKELVAFLQKQLNRPIRVCGMVANEGEPGGGPFIVLGKDGVSSLQIVESSQIDFDNPEQADLFEQATHFNPVDLVCSTQDYQGNKFNLLDYVDESMGFITSKSVKGRHIQALELPGLWNGAMAKWNTFFVEVPAHTFNPVKTVFDLLLPEHSN